jgi:hypothetical protein
VVVCRALQIEVMNTLIEAFDAGENWNGCKHRKRYCVKLGLHETTHSFTVFIAQYCQGFIDFIIIPGLARHAFNST